MSIIVKQLTRRFSPGGSPAVSDVSFQAPAGAITSLLGPSGAGKSTLLRLICGLEVPDVGRVLIDGLDCTALPVQKRNVGVVFQSYALFRHMTVRENIAFGLNVRRLPRDEVEARVDEMLRLVQLEALGSRHPGQLSGGQRQRVAFARALAIRPRVLLLDEPFGALDTRVREELREWLHELHERTGLTTLLVTHDQQEALEISQHVVVMSEGRVAQAGSPEDIYDRPASPFVASFIGGASVLRGHVLEGRAALGSLALSVPAAAREGEAVHAFVRPHDIKLARSVSVAGAGERTPFMGRVERFKPVGGFVKVLLRMPSGDEVTVQVPRSEFEALGVVEGDAVRADVLTASVFVGDYAI
ncbi:sulfate/molybdate ABC transporter ATP-binding protein [Myxococcus sp. CA056]|uniref:sulfate/molybdate ABC transporter ATP-binding protein n=1 Tax=unclassified Myxococcus TaxID=2648731 RepID=UPI00157B2EA4|nr:MULTISPECIES: sulfate/molybdate ABC transporter ATP-binding protein [unclassified Myxococcus]NTX16826.1 sulfate/molybdate ABC transporter ATP-binding protein [Myxococcus sp. CA056]NTX56023.1 sulfate/molybdate ABC transporter ATP-binding protein [Myxococcus sp. CA039A]